MNKKPPLGLEPRDIWLRDRVIDCIDALYRLRDEEDCERFKRKSYELSKELEYAVTEWDKFYPDDCYVAKTDNVDYDKLRKDFNKITEFE